MNIDRPVARLAGPCQLPCSPYKKLGTRRHGKTSQKKSVGKLKYEEDILWGEYEDISVQSEQWDTYKQLSGNIS